MTNSDFIQFYQSPAVSCPFHLFMLNSLSAEQTLVLPARKHSAYFYPPRRIIYAHSPPVSTVPFPPQRFPGPSPPGNPPLFPTPKVLFLHLLTFFPFLSVCRKPNTSFPGLFPRSPGHVWGNVTFRHLETFHITDVILSGYQRHQGDGHFCGKCPVSFPDFPEVCLMVSAACAC